MAAFAPIPSWVLDRDMEVRVPAGGDYGGEFAGPVTVLGVAFFEVDAIGERHVGGGRSGYVFQDGSRGLVYVDAVRSSGGFDVPPGSLVEIGGEQMSVVKCTPHAPGGVMHHWEIEVR